MNLWSWSLIQWKQTTNVAQYWSLLGYLFVPTDGAGAAGLNYIRVPLGASDFSADLYSYDDTNGDTSFANFNIKVAPSYVFSTLADILSLNDSMHFRFLSIEYILKFFVSQCSGFMSFLGVHLRGWKPLVLWTVEAWLPALFHNVSELIIYSVIPKNESILLDATYLLKCLQGFAAEGLTPYAIGKVFSTRTSRMANTYLL